MDFNMVEYWLVSRPARGSDDPPPTFFAGHYKVNPCPINCSNCRSRQRALQTVYPPPPGLASPSFINPASSRGMERLFLQKVIISIQVDPPPPPPCVKLLATPKVYSNKKAIHIGPALDFMDVAKAEAPLHPANQCGRLPPSCRPIRQSSDVNPDSWRRGIVDVYSVLGSLLGGTPCCQWGEVRIAILGQDHMYMATRERKTDLTSVGLP